MKNILILGAGKSSTALIKYLLEKSGEENFTVTVADLSVDAAQKKIGVHPNAKAISLDINDAVRRGKAIGASSIVISMLPPDLHIIAARDCVNLRVSLVTASYVSDAIRALEPKAREAGVLLLNECGLDPGMDHMSAMKIIHQLKKEECTIESFKSFTGGLIAPESNTNPWGYKFTWNPRNVILAGQGTAQYLENGKQKFIPYSRLFNQPAKIFIDGYGLFDGYANRNSLAYCEHYGLQNIKTLLRGTLRNIDFCKAWNVFVQLGLTDDTFQIFNTENLRWQELTAAFIPDAITGSSLRQRVAKLCQLEEQDPALDKVEWTGILSDLPVGLHHGSPARMLQTLLESKWELEENDKDMIIMHHDFGYKTKSGADGRLESSLVIKGTDSTMTAMAKTVGLPLGIAALNLLNKNIKLTGVSIPVHQEIYIPILKELEKHGINFTEKESVSSV
ncbi:MAG: saccharopine dehydrogenase NADP-binding domain-containing protein [Bacteroidia bacterium]|nr:saccharopine dehydrogenase NADP-binding domain-containing protein [Bacteroidia bacterium]MCZ2277257.1 saccharopine dehydrogenase NADP-binding domain-containing protein [Bacteroidia bacterium]